MWLFWIIIGIVAFLAYYGYKAEKKGKENASSKLNELNFAHNITVSFTSMAGCIAFCDDEQILISYRDWDSRLVEIKYETILSCEKVAGINGVSFWALTPTYTEYLTGDVGADRLKELMDKFNSIVATNTFKARTEYNNIISIPSNAAYVHIKRCVGYSSLISSNIRNINEITGVNFWTNRGKVYMMPVFKNLAHFKNNPNFYRPITIDKKNIVSLTQEGAVHYATEIHGGGGGGSSIKGAIVGGMIAGEAGAIIGSRKATDPITSTTNKIDDRTANLKILDSNNSFCEILFDYNDYYAISKLIKI